MKIAADARDYAFVTDAQQLGDGKVLFGEDLVGGMLAHQTPSPDTPHKKSKKGVRPESQFIESAQSWMVRSKAQ